MRPVALVIALAACGDNGGSDAVDAVPADAFAPADAFSCEPGARSVFRLDLFSPLLHVDFNGCPSLSLVDCVGTHAFVDGSTAEILDQFPRCDPSCPR